MIWEQDVPVILDYLAIRYMRSAVIALLFQGLRAEQAARFLAMENSTKNAEKYLECLTLQFNKLRQGLITKEITEEIAEGVGLGVGTVRGKDEADHDDLRAEEDAEAQRGADGQGVQHRCIVADGFSSVHPTISLRFPLKGPIAQKDRAAVS